MYLDTIFNRERITNFFLHNQLLVFFSIVFIFFSLLFFVNSGYYAMVFADEYVYSKHSRHMDLSTSPTSGYLYFYIYGLTNVCGDSFLNCTRYLNLLFLAFGCIPLYKISRMVLGPSTSILVSVSPMISPIGTYSAYFMPETPFLFFFLCFSWLLLRLHHDNGIQSWVLVGFILGLSSLIKPHAQFLVLPLLVYVVLLMITETNYWIRSSIRAVTTVIATGLITKLLIGTVLAGTAAFSLFGSTYGNIANSTLDNDYLQLLKDTIHVGIGHLFSISLILSLQIIICLIFIFDYSVNYSKYRHRKVPSEIRISFFVFVTLLSYIGISSIFTSVVAGQTLTELTNRLHVRYYNFVFPIFLVVTFAALRSFEIGFRKRITYGIILILLSVFSVLYLNSNFQTSFLDGPELNVFINGNIYGYILVFLIIVSIIFWIISNANGLKFYILVHFLFVITAMNASILIDRSPNRVPDVFVQAAGFVRAYLPAHELGHVTVAGYSHPGILKALFYLDSPDATQLLLPSDTKPNVTFPEDVGNWILLIGGEYQSSKGFKTVFNHNDFRLIARVEN